MKLFKLPKFKCFVLVVGIILLLILKFCTIEVSFVAEYTSVLKGRKVADLYLLKIRVDSTLVLIKFYNCQSHLGK